MRSCLHLKRLTNCLLQREVKTNAKTAERFSKTKVIRMNNQIWRIPKILYRRKEFELCSDRKLSMVQMRFYNTRNRL